MPKLQVVPGVILKDGKILCAKLKKTPGKDSTDFQEFWCTPGGGVDIGEPLLPALEREMIEETGVKPDIGSLLYVQQFQYGDLDNIEFFFHITNSEDFEHIDLTATSHGEVEIAEIGFIDPKTETILPAFLAERDLAADAAAGTTNVFNYIETNNS
ncbi:MAG: NUDIX domain-containing protein [Candidatus Saccharibacteria bacterium]|nr:NUDIX domain-containing protein [Candidatus Saccharibacteria bacterium]